MKLILVLMICALAAAAPSIENQNAILQAAEISSLEERNVMVNALVRQLIAYLRRIINNGSALFGSPPLDPLVLEDFELNIPAGLINLHLKLKDVLMTGFGGFETPLSDLNLRDMTFDLVIVFPRLDISTGEYNLVGDLYNAIPLYGKGPAEFVVEDFTIRAKLHLKQSDNEQSILIDWIEAASFEIPSFKSNIVGAIGGGNIDAIVNAIVEDVTVGYVNRFQGIIALISSHLFVEFMNPVLDGQDTWKYIAPFIPRN